MGPAIETWWPASQCVSQRTGLNEPCSRDTGTASTQLQVATLTPRSWRRPSVGLGTAEILGEKPGERSTDFDGKRPYRSRKRPTPNDVVHQEVLDALRDRPKTCLGGEPWAPGVMSTTGADDVAGARRTATHDVLAGDLCVGNPGRLTRDVAADR